jgi:hypothetical protein
MGDGPVACGTIEALRGLLTDIGLGGRRHLHSNICTIVNGPGMPLLP